MLGSSSGDIRDLAGDLKESFGAWSKHSSSLSRWPFYGLGSGEMCPQVQFPGANFRQP